VAINLIPPVYDILEKVRQVTLKEIRLVERDDLSTYAALRMARANYFC